MNQIKRYQKIIFALISIVIIIFGTLYIKKEIAIKKSIENFQAAENSEKEEDYHTALELYSLVIPDDNLNFEKARKKINEIERRFKDNKMAALGFKILKEVGEVDTLDDLSEIQVDSESEEMTCMINGIGYSISKTIGESGTYQQAIISSDGTYCIMKYEAEKEYGGWFSNDINMINQDVSDGMYDLIKITTSPDLISNKLIQEYIEEN